MTAKPHPPRVDITWARSFTASETPEQRAQRRLREQAINRAMRSMWAYAKAVRKDPPCAPPESPQPDSSS